MPPKFRHQPGPKELEWLRSDEIVWLITVRRDGQPQPVPVWYLWEDDVFFIYAMEHSQKLRNIRANPRVSLTLDSRNYGDSVVRADGIAEILDDPIRPLDHATFMEKYRAGIDRIGRTPQSFHDDYTHAITVAPSTWYIW